MQVESKSEKIVNQMREGKMGVTDHKGLLQVQWEDSGAGRLAGVRQGRLLDDWGGGGYSGCDSGLESEDKNPLL